MERKTIFNRKTYKNEQKIKAAETAVNKETIVNKSTSEFWDMDPIKSTNAMWRLVIGERSNGKTFALLKEAINLYVSEGKKTAYIRRTLEDIRPKNIGGLFAPLYTGDINYVMLLTNGEYNSVIYEKEGFKLCNVKENGNIVKDVEEFCHAFAINGESHYRGTAWPTTDLIFFDEFMSNTGYLTGEVGHFLDVVSTIKRKRKVTIYLIGNTINWDAPYFKDLNVFHIRDMKKGTIDIYRYGGTDETVAVEMCDDYHRNKSHKNNDFNVWNNERVAMISSGDWVMGRYPHLQYLYEKKNIIFQFFIDYGDEPIHAEVISRDDLNFIYFHKKTTPLVDDGNTVIFSPEATPLPNHFQNLLKSKHKIAQRVRLYFDEHLVFFQDNLIGEEVNNYLMWCQKN